MKVLIKKYLCIMLCAFLIFTLTACGDSEEVQEDTSEEEIGEDAGQDITSLLEGEVQKEPAEGFSHDGIDIDITLMSSTMIYSEVYNMMYYPEEFVGKVIRLEGLYGEYYDEELEKRYFGCIVQDATACCAQGVEFELKDEYVYPDDYPEIDDMITVQGTFDTYEEDGFIFAILREAELITD